MECFPVDWIPEEATLATPMIISDLYPFTTREGLEQEASLMLSLYYHSTAPSTNPMAGHLRTCANCAYEAMSLHKDLTANPGEDPNDRDLSADFMLPSMWHDFGMADTTETNLRASDRAAVVDMVKLYTRAYQIQSRIVDQLHNDMLLWRHLVEDEANAHVATGELWKANEDQLFFQGPSSALEKQSIWQTTVLELLGRNMMIMTHWLINATTEVGRSKGESPIGKEQAVSARVKVSCKSQPPASGAPPTKNSTVTTAPPSSTHTQLSSQTHHQPALMLRPPQQWQPLRRNITSLLRHSRPTLPSITTSRHLVTLAIETSCDDTAVAILEDTNDADNKSPDANRSRCRSRNTTLHFNERISSDSREFKGIKPSVATRGHNESLAKLIEKAIPHLPRHAPKPDFVCATRGPGINPNLSIGLSTAKGLAVAWGVPLVGVHHMQAHALTPRLVRALGMPMATSTSTSTTPSPPPPPPTTTTPSSGPDFPFLSLLVSGGHTQLVHSASLTEHRIVATTGDTAIGNILDQTARVILPPAVLDASPDVMYGRVLEKYAFPGPEPDYASFFTPASSRAEEMLDAPTGYDWTLGLPFRQSRRLAYSFSSIYTNVHKIAAAAAEERQGMDDAERRALARHTMRAAFQHLVSRLCLALEDVPGLSEVSTLVVAGGVASNRFLMHVLRTTLDARGFGHVEILAPPIELCTDNAAMIAWTGMEMYRAGWHSDLSVMTIPRWPLDPDAGENTGLLGVDGWLKR